MNITREILKDNHEKISILLEKNDYWSEVNKSLKKYANKASIKGFRPGKVPQAVVIKMYGNQVMAETLTELLSDKLQEFLKKEQVNILGRPLALADSWPMIDIKHPASYEFAYEIGISPEFVIPLLEGSSKTFTEYKVIATPEDIDKEIDRQQKRLGETTTIEENASVEKGDNVFFKLVEILPTVIAEDQEAREPLVCENGLPFDLFSETGKKAIKGMKIGDSKKIDIFQAIEKSKEDIMRFVLSTNEEKHPNLSSQFQIEITKVSRVTPAEVNQTFFDKLLGPGEVDNEADFRAFLKSEIEQGNNQYTLQNLHNDFVNELMETTHIPLPASFLEKYLNASLEKPIPPQEYPKELWNYQQATKWNLIRSKMAQKFELSVQEEEIDGYIYTDIQRQLMQYAPQILSDVDKVDGFVQRMKADKKYVEQAYLRILDDKIFTNISEVVNKDVKEVTTKEYEAIIEKANQNELAKQGNENNNIEDAQIVAEEVAEKSVKKAKATTAKAKEPKPDNLTKIEGIGPKIASLFVAAGYTSFAELAEAKIEDLKQILLDNKLGIHTPDTWPRQAKLAAEGKWDELKQWQDTLDGGKEVK